MKKVLSILLVTVLLMGSLIILTGCDNGNEAGVTKDGVTLKLDMAHFNKKVYTSSIKLSKDQKVDEFDEDEPNFVRILNEEGNYVIDITLDENPSDAMEGFKETASEQDEYTETKFGKYEGYTYLTDEDMVAEIILDDSDENANVYLLVSVYLDNEDDEEKNDIKEIFNSSEVQNLLKSISFKSADAKSSDE